MRCFIPSASCRVHMSESLRTWRYSLVIWRKHISSFHNPCSFTNQKFYLFFRISSFSLRFTQVEDLCENLLSSYCFSPFDSTLIRPKWCPCSSRTWTACRSDCKHWLIRRQKRYEFTNISRVNVITFNFLSLYEWLLQSDQRLEIIHGCCSDIRTSVFIQTRLYGPQYTSSV